MAKSHLVFNNPVEIHVVDQYSALFSMLCFPTICCNVFKNFILPGLDLSIGPALDYITVYDVVYLDQVDGPALSFSNSLSL